MATALLAFLAACIDEAPALITAIESLLGAKKQQYSSVLASVQAETAANVAALDASYKV